MKKALLEYSGIALACVLSTVAFLWLMYWAIYFETYIEYKYFHEHRVKQTIEEMEEK